MIQFKLLVCYTLADTGILLSKMAPEQLQTWQDYSTNTLYVKQTAIPLYAIQDIELLPDRKTTVALIADRTNDLQHKETIEGQSLVWVWSNDSSKPLQPVVATFYNDKNFGHISQHYRPNTIYKQRFKSCRVRHAFQRRRNDQL